VGRDHRFKTTIISWVDSNNKTNFKDIKQWFQTTTCRTIKISTTTWDSNQTCRTNNTTKINRWIWVTRINNTWVINRWIIIRWCRITISNINSNSIIRTSNITTKTNRMISYHILTSNNNNSFNNQWWCKTIRFNNSKCLTNKCSNQWCSNNSNKSQSCNSSNHLLRLSRFSKHLSFNNRK